MPRAGEGLLGPEPKKVVRSVWGGGAKEGNGRRGRRPGTKCWVFKAQARNCFPPRHDPRTTLTPLRSTPIQALDSFVSTRDDARAELEAAVAAAAADFQSQLAADDAGIAEDMGALDDDKVMRLTEQEVHQVGTWEQRPQGEEGGAGGEG